jgi:hypothetical protein
MATAKMKSSPRERVQHVVVVDVDGALDEVLTASAADADDLAAAVVEAAAELGTVVLPIGGMSANGFTVLGQVVLDLGKARRTAVRVEHRPLQSASMGIKK